VVYKLSADPDAAEIAAALNTLRSDSGLRCRLAAAGRQYTKDFHDPATCAAQYATAIFEFAQRQKALSIDSSARALAPFLAATPDTPRACRLAADFLDARPRFRFARPRLIIDVSYTSNTSSKTGIQRVVRKTVKGAYCRPYPGLDAVAVNRVGNTLVEAIDWLAEKSLLLPHEVGQPPQAIEFRAGDCLLMLDSSWHEYAHFGGIFNRARAAKANIVTAIYDMLPLTLPQGDVVEGGREWFAGWLKIAIERSDGLVCISKAVADDVIAYIVKNRLGHNGLRVGYWHLGSETRPATECPQNSPVQNSAMRPYCLMVGTIEPRKNHALALDAFEKMWAQGSPLNLVIAGHTGWLVDQLMRRIHTHPMLNRQLFLFEGTSDDEIAHLYRNAAALLFVSKGEGFGLPLVEAAGYGTPIICSDIPIFREIADGNAQFVNNSDSAQLASEISAWWMNYQNGNIPQPHMTRLSWEQSAEALIDIVIGQKWYWEYRDPA